MGLSIEYLTKKIMYPGHHCSHELYEILNPEHCECSLLQGKFIDARIYVISTSHFASLECLALIAKFCD